MATSTFLLSVLHGRSRSCSSTFNTYPAFLYCLPLCFRSSLSLSLFCQANFSLSHPLCLLSMSVFSFFTLSLLIPSPLSCSLLLTLVTLSSLVCCIITKGTPLPTACPLCAHHMRPKVAGLCVCWPVEHVRLFHSSSSSSSSSSASHRQACGIISRALRRSPAAVFWSLSNATAAWLRQASCFTESLSLSLYLYFYLVFTLSISL